ncbi:flagellar filament capping protein FliD, partial [Bacillus sp. WP8]|uniref:flagellar filament capping protein FliD n=1 Tax=Bacillus sp. WP8 TaxID=756828 RepID=UPI0037BE591F
MTYQLKPTTHHPLTLNLSTHLHPIYHKIKQFLDKYNHLLHHINPKLNQNKNTHYQPLTPQHKKPISQKQIHLSQTTTNSPF